MGGRVCTFMVFTLKERNCISFNFPSWKVKLYGVFVSCWLLAHRSQHRRWRDIRYVHLVSSWTDSVIFCCTFALHRQIHLYNQCWWCESMCFCPGKTPYRRMLKPTHWITVSAWMRPLVIFWRWCNCGTASNWNHNDLVTCNWTSEESYQHAQ